MGKKKINRMISALTALMLLAGTGQVPFYDARAVSAEMLPYEVLSDSSVVSDDDLRTASAFSLPEGTASEDFIVSADDLQVPGTDIVSPAASYASGHASSAGKVPAFVPGIIPEKQKNVYPSSSSGEDTSPDSGASFSDILVGDGSYPSTYLSEPTPVKDQGINGLCWDFTAIGLLESCLKKKGYGDYDLSEAHMSYAMSSQGGNPYGENRTPGGSNAGGNRAMAAAYLMRGMPDNHCIGGAVFETYDPFTEAYVNNGLPYRSWSDTVYNKPKQLMPENIYYLSDLKSTSYSSGLNNTVKAAVMNYGAVGASLEWGDDGSNTATNPCYNASTAAFYRPANRKGSGTDHSVLIIGWDDSYPAGNFRSGNQPPGNGAWRIKNSWGTKWGSQGYGWVSYYDAWLPSDAFTIDGVTGFDSSTLRIYEYDYTSPESYFSYGSNTSYLAMRYYQAQEDAVVTEIMVSLQSGGSTVEVDVMPDVSGIDSYTFQSRGQVYASCPGWYTIKLSNPVLIHKGAWFGAVIRTAANLNCDNYFTADSGFYSGSWSYRNNGYCIKAKVTNDAEMVNVYRAWEYLQNDTNLWNLIRGSNTDHNHVRLNLAAPGAGPYGTRYAYTVESSPYLDSTGRILRPVCSYTNPVAASFKLEVSLNSWSFTIGCTIRIDPTEHQYSAWSVTAPATELAAGTQTRTCAVCRRTETSQLQKLSPSLSTIPISRSASLKKGITVYWKKLSKSRRKLIKKIQIQISTNKKFTKNLKTVKVDAKKTSKTFKKLQSGKRYYLRIRAYTKAGNTVHISAWSPVISLKAK